VYQGGGKERPAFLLTAGPLKGCAFDAECWKIPVNFLQLRVLEDLGVLVAGLMSHEPAAAAALALRHLCDACREMLGPFVQELLMLYERIQAGGVVRSCNSSANFALNESEILLVSPSKRIASTLPTRFPLHCS
jgi:hypothetical protein